MAGRLADEFGTSHERNLRLTALIRWFTSNPEYEGLFEGEKQDEWNTLTKDLPAVLREQPGDSNEERWNNLMDEFGYQAVVEGGVYLEPWDDFDEETYDPEVSHER